MIKFEWRLKYYKNVEFTSTFIHSPFLQERHFEASLELTELEISDSYHTLAFKYVFNKFHSNISFKAPWKHQKTFDFLMFSRGSKGNIGKK